jgi:hypothetical protein
LNLWPQVPWMVMTPSLATAAPAPRERTAQYRAGQRGGDGCLPRNAHFLPRLVHASSHSGAKLANAPGPVSTATPHPLKEHRVQSMAAGDELATLFFPRRGATPREWSAAAQDAQTEGSRASAVVWCSTARLFPGVELRVRRYPLCRRRLEEAVNPAYSHEVPPIGPFPAT